MRFTGRGFLDDRNYFARVIHGADSVMRGVVDFGDVDDAIPRRPVLAGGVECRQQGFKVVGWEHVPEHDAAIQIIAANSLIGTIYAAGEPRIFQARSQSQATIHSVTNDCAFIGPKARFIPAWGNAPGQRAFENGRAEGPLDPLFGAGFQPLILSAFGSQGVAHIVIHK